MRRLAGQLVARMRRLTSAAAVDTPPRRWAEELADAGLTFDQWIARRQAASRLFVDLAGRAHRAVARIAVRR